MKFYPTIGLEIHAELNTMSKMFCFCENSGLERHPNTSICPVCMGHPGTLPTINEKAVRKVIKMGMALNCKISERSKFDRKNYFYPDLPKGYQISQFYFPFCKEGFLEVGGQKVKVREIHLEEDTGKLIHIAKGSESKLSDEDIQDVPKDPSGQSFSLIDFNRAGVPLMELVTEPDLKSAKEARRFSEELQLILRYLGVSDADMEKGQMRVEANISVSKNNTLGTKVEIKNLNSFRVVEKAIDFEIERQAEILEKGKKITQETRGWNAEESKTFSQREKEEAHDYRYFPEPDLPEILVSKEFIQEIQSEIPELPWQKRKRFNEEFGISAKDIEIFVQNKALGEYFEKVVSEFEADQPVEKFKKLIKLASNYLITDLLGLLKGGSVLNKGFLISPENFAELIILIGEEKVSSNIAKIVLEEMFKTGADPSHIVEDKGLILISDAVEIEEIVREIILKNPKAVDDYKKGNANAFQFLIGQTMAKTQGKISIEIAKKTILKLLTP